MDFEKKFSKIPRLAKYAILAFVFVIGIILLTNSRVSHNFWRNEHVSNEIFTVNINEENTHPESITTGKKDRNEVITLKIDANSEHISTFQMLVNDPTACFKKYDAPLTSDVLFESQNPTYAHMLSTFNKILASIQIKAAMIEPSIIYCMLDTKYRNLFIKRHFDIAKFNGLNSITTFGIIENDATRLQMVDNIRKFRSNGFQPYFLQASPAEWMMKNRTELKEYTSNIFYRYYDWTIHVAVFHRRNNYLWHAELNSKDALNIPHKNDLLFANHDSAYENFTFVPLGVKWPSLINFYIPSSPHYFLFQISSSRFLECNLTRSADVNSSTDSPTSHSYLSVEKFNSRALVALHELKKLFNPLLMHFWIFSGTMLGWYRQCDIIPYTSDVDFGAWASDIDDLDFILKQVTQNKNLRIRERMGMLEEALEFNLNFDNLRVDVFFMYKIDNGSWASGHRPSKGYYFRYYYPPFTLCSAELLREKVLVPCETEDVIVTEYGPNWMKPVSSWYYESSIHNRGPNIYWDEKRRPNVFKEY